MAILNETHLLNKACYPFSWLHIPRSKFLHTYTCNTLIGLNINSAWNIYFVQRATWKSFHIFLLIGLCFILPFYQFNSLPCAKPSQLVYMNAIRYWAKLY